MDLKVGPKNSALEFLPLLAIQYLNIPYIFGGKNCLTGLDCSGLACELLASLGIIPRNEEMGSQVLHDFLITRSVDGEICLGSLAFYGASSSKIDHVAMFLDTHLVIEAAHGDQTTTTLAAAQARNARVRVSPYNYRKDLVAVLRPKYEDYGFHD